MGKSTLRTPIYQTGATKPIGYVVADELRVTVNGARHFLRRRPVLAFSERAIAKAEAAGATSIVVNDKETGKAYRVTLAALRVNGKQFDMGYEKRVGLHISQWDEVEAEEQLPLWA